MKRILLTVIISIVVFVVGSYFIGQFENKQIANVNLGEKYTIIAGVIRNEGNGWELIQDKTHETIGITSIEQDDKKIIVRYDKFSKINSVSITTDETMASEGYTVGASVGDDVLWIDIYDKNHSLVNPKDYNNSRGNIWINGIFRK